MAAPLLGTETMTKSLLWGERRRRNRGCLFDSEYRTSSQPVTVERIPKATLSEVNVRLALVVSVTILRQREPTVAMRRRRSSAVRVDSVPRPLWFRKSMVNGILQIAAPKILKKVEVLPMELGLMTNSMPSPFEVKGTFTLEGTSLKLLTEDMASLEDVCRACEATPLQLAMFLAMQRYCMERGPYHELKSVDDVIKYMKKYRRSTQLWRSICFNWEQACSLYCEGVQIAKADEATRAGAAPLRQKCTRCVSSTIS